jgi:hypothetical protein
MMMMMMKHHLECDERMFIIVLSKSLTVAFFRLQMVHLPGDYDYYSILLYTV